MITDDRQPGGSELKRQLLENLDRCVIDDALGGVPHSHTTLVEGCFRCDLNKDEPGGNGARSTVYVADHAAHCDCHLAAQKLHVALERVTAERDAMREVCDAGKLVRDVLDDIRTQQREAEVVERFDAALRSLDATRKAPDDATERDV